jgi:hypothetical protein
LYETTGRVVNKTFEPHPIFGMKIILPTLLVSEMVQSEREPT